MKLVFLFLVLSLLALPSVSAATTLINGQQTIDITVQAGRNYTFYLIFSSVDPSNITATGDLAPWILFGDAASSHTFSSFSSLTVLRITVNVPSGTADGELKGFISANDVILSQVVATVLPSTSAIATLRTQADVNAKIDTLKGSIAEVKAAVQSSAVDVLTSAEAAREAASKISSDQNRLSSLEQENTQLESRLVDMQKTASTQITAINESAEIKQKLDRITGQVVGEKNFGFAAGLIVGAVFVYVFLNFRSVKGIFSRRFRLRFSPGSVQ